MRKCFQIFIGLISLFTILSSHCQSKITLDSVSSETSIAWIKNLYEPGVRIDEDSISISPEVNLLLTDSLYRASAYPEKYTWEAAVILIQKTELKKAFWYLINLYLTNDQKSKNIVVKTVLAYDRLFIMDKVLVSSFYTYCYTDPEIGTIKNGQPDITKPNVLETKFDAMKEIIYFVEKYKKEHPEEK